MKHGRAGSSGGWLTAPTAITLVVLTTLPFWIEQVGLDQHLGVEEEAKP